MNISEPYCFSPEEYGILPLHRLVSRNRSTKRRRPRGERDKASKIPPPGDPRAVQVLGTRCALPPHGKCASSISHLHLSVARHLAALTLFTLNTQNPPSGQRRPRNPQRVKTTVPFISPNHPQPGNRRAVCYTSVLPKIPIVADLQSPVPVLRSTFPNPDNGRVMFRGAGIREGVIDRAFPKPAYISSARRGANAH